MTRTTVDLLERCHACEAATSGILVRRGSRMY